MYEIFYNLKEKPFNNNPDPRFFYPSPKHEEALNRLTYAIEERKGFIVITGEIGSGKTTICRKLLRKLDNDRNEIALITNTHLNAKDLLVAILEDLQVDYKPGTKIKLLSQLNDFLIRKMEDGKNVILIIDEAQNLSPSVLEEVRMLSNLETDTEKLLQIILLGQPQLREKLQKKNLEQFIQRISVHYHLYPLTKEETYGYIRHRLSAASQNGTPDVFAPEALDLAYKFSQGVPRLINYVCDNALLSGFVYERREIDGKLMREVIDESHFGFEEDEVAADAVKTYCCPHCQAYEKCPTKWTRAERGEEQICCESCSKYGACH